MKESYCRVKDLVGKSKLSRRTVMRYVEKGYINVIRLGKRCIIIPVEEVEKFISVTLPSLNRPMIQEAL